MPEGNTITVKGCLEHPTGNYVPQAMITEPTHSNNVLKRYTKRHKNALMNYGSHFMEIYVEII